MPVRLPPAVVVLVIAAMFVAGLFIHGVVGGVFLAATDLVLIALSYTSSDRPTERGLALRVVVLVAVAALAVAKLTGHV